MVVLAGIEVVGRGSGLCGMSSLGWTGALVLSSSSLLVPMAMNSNINLQRIVLPSVVTLDYCTYHFTNICLHAFIFIRTVRTTCMFSVCLLDPPSLWF